MTTQRIIDFMGHRKLAAAVSILLIVGSLLSLSIKGVTLGLDFTGGTQIELGYQQPADLEAIRSQLAAAKFDNPVVVHFGSESDVLIRLQGKPEAGLSDDVLKALGNGDNGVELRRVDYVGPQVGDELREDGGLGMLAALAIVMLYIAIRF